jgi:hypothetical protein
MRSSALVNGAWEIGGTLIVPMLVEEDRGTRLADRAAVGPDGPPLPRRSGARWTGVRTRGVRPGGRGGDPHHRPGDAAWLPMGTGGRAGRDRAAGGGPGGGTLSRRRTLSRRM